MSMISELVKDLHRVKRHIDPSEKDMFVCSTVESMKIICTAIDTIESLSAKVAAANMERSERYYGSADKLIEEMAEEIENCYGRETELSQRAREYLSEVNYNGGWIACEERLPEEPYGCLVTVIDSAFNGSSFEDFENILPYHVGYDGEQWNDSDGEKIPFEVIAWQPLPSPYRKEDRS